MSYSNSTISGYPTVPLHPPIGNYNYTPGIIGGTDSIAIGGTNITPTYTTIIGSTNITPTYATNSEHGVILGGNNVSSTGSSYTIIISATDRPFESNTSKSIYLRSDQGVFVEDPDQPDHFINLTQELSQTRQELKELKEIVDQLYYAPGAPGYVQAEADFHHQAEGLSSSPKN